MDFGVRFPDGEVVELIDESWARSFIVDCKKEEEAGDKALAGAVLVARQTPDDEWLEVESDASSG